MLDTRICRADQHSGVLMAAAKAVPVHLQGDVKPRMTLDPASALGCPVCDESKWAKQIGEAAFHERINQVLGAWCTGMMR